ncbi:LysR family transcriptional regulator [Rhizobium sp. TH2]|uniref:LysR substrate-binding domain-containing protein n=1 Tax=Rhizobium sp. TH2 TaxID=2775403 RepID=UPI0021582901|nr:LysR substrate-binding domain-containing protein [Rhizobium sp. TH2]UVC09099.1 LysR family transcriptional regulator [Rhizobium sp. TH2]
MRNLNTVHMNGLRALEAVGRLGSLQAAADELGVSVGAISQQVIKTELQLGHQIFERTGKGLVATEIGLPVLARLTDGIQKLAEAVTLAQRRDNNCLTISVAPVFASRWLVRRFDSFAREHPEIILRIDATMRLIDPASSDIDLGIRVGEGDWPDVNSELILAQEVYPVCAPQLAEKLKTPADILSMPAVIDDRAMFKWDVWLDAAGLQGTEISQGHVFNEASLCLDAVMAGQGVMLAWQTLTADMIAEGRLAAPFNIRARTGFGHYFITAKGVRDSRKVQIFKAWLKRELAKSMADLHTRLAAFNMC